MGSKILLADDSITIQKVVNLTFADEGIEVISVSNGDQAERRLKEVDPDLVLADIFMPGKNGYELCELIKQTPQFRDVPVVLLVGAFEPFNEAEARRVNADAHLTKPFESRVLVETVKQLIEKSAKPKNIATTTQAMGSQLPAEPPPQAPRPFPMPAIDLSAMTAPYPPQESVFADRVPTSNLADPTPFADSFPANFDFGNQDPPVKAAQVDLLASVNTAFTSEAQPIVQATDNAPTAASTDFAQNNLADVFNMDMFAAPLPVEAPQPQHHHSADLFDIPTTFEVPTAPVVNDVVIADAVGTPVEKTAAMVVDFEQVDPLGESVPAALSAFEIAPEPVANDQKTSQEEAVARKFDTNELKSPLLDSTPAPTSEFVQAAFNGASNNHTPANKGFDFHTDSAAEHSASSLLSADDPLGDLLFNEFPQETFTPQVEVVAPLEFEAPVAKAVEVPGEAIPEKVLATPPETRGFIQDTSELTNPEASNVEVLQPSDADVTVTINRQQPEISFTTQETPLNTGSAPLNPAQDSTGLANHDFDLLMPEKVEPLSVETTTSAASEVNFYTEPQPNEPSEAVAAAETAKANEVEAVAGFGQQELQPLDAAETEASEATAQEEKFTASDMWAAETQFTPVSIAPVPVADYHATQPPDTQVTSVAQTAAAGFDHPDSPSLGAQQTFDTPQKDVSHLEETPQKGVEMKQEMIDEIVRRVVAQLSDTVVREIAWEVVPDCVERVVSSLTKADLAKRM